MSDAYRAQLHALAFGHAIERSTLPGFEVYRDMIRMRLCALARGAYRRSWALLGEAACEACFARWLALAPPSSPLVREVIADFGAFALGDALADEAAFARDLLRFEAIRWTVADAPAPAPPLTSELDFDGEPVLNPTLRVLALTHAVDVLQGRPEPIAPTSLLIYRRSDDDHVRWYRVGPLCGALLSRARETRLGIGCLLPDLLAERGLTADPALLNELASALTVAVERGVVLGVRAAQASPR